METTDVRRKTSTGYPLWISLFIYWLLTLALLIAAIGVNDGYFGYPQDDTYIHMAIGKHFVESGSWSVSNASFTSSTSSPLWTFLIALSYKIFGVNDWAPFVLCLLAGSVLVYLLYRLLQRVTNPLRQTVFLLFVILLAPLPVLTLIGMEHVLHGLFTVWLLYSAVALLIQREAGLRQAVPVFVLSGLVTITRYEGLFLVFAISVLLLVQKRYRISLLTGAAGLLPITLYGLFSISQGWYFFPNSLLLKGNTPGFGLERLAIFFQQLPKNLNSSPHVLVLMIASIFIYLVLEQQNKAGARERYLVILFVLMTLIHMQFASVEGFFRYEAYIVLSGSLVLVDLLNVLLADQSFSLSSDKLLNFGFIAVLGLLIVIPLGMRTGEAFKDYPIAVTNIHDQQHQMGLFVQKFYSGKAVAANDIGEINYLADIQNLDLFGLGSLEVTQGRQEGVFDQDFIAGQVSKNDVEIIMIFKIWFEGQIPPQWIEVGSWQIEDNIVCGDDTVTFFVPDASMEQDAIAHLREFANDLPVTVKQSGKYVSQEDLSAQTK